MITSFSKKKMIVHRKIIQIGFLFIITLLIAAWHHPSRNDLIYFGLVTMAVIVFFEIVSPRIERQSFFLERVLFYSAMIAVASIIIPVVDAFVMFTASFVYDLVEK